jgi:hypothetical protein
MATAGCRPVSTARPRLVTVLMYIGVLLEWWMDG